MNNIKIGVIGLGYVGLPLAVEFGAHFDVIGYDTSKSRIDDLSNKYDKTHEVNISQFEKATFLKFSDLSVSF